MPEVIVLNGGSSSGKTSIARALQEILPRPWLRFSVDDAFLGGAASAERVRAAFDGLAVLWVGVRCDPGVAAGREAARGDRVAGMATAQAELVHRGVVYDVSVDTSRTPAADCARAIAVAAARSG